MANETILVVEDNDANMVVATALLTPAGYKLLKAKTAEDGMALAAGAGPDLILMDVSLPGMDGLTAAGLLKADGDTKHIPIIALTAFAMRGDEEKALAAGCDGYVTKPIDKRTLLAKIAGILENRT
ncbi:MAG: response regulator [Pseudomonadota bacterium]